MNKTFVFVITLLVTISSLAQKVTFPKWGQFSEFERSLSTYELDTTANAVVLNEMGYSRIQDGGQYEIIKEHYVRIKILNKNGFSNATIEIPSYHKEKVKDIKASTTNFTEGKKTSYVKKSEIYKTQVRKNWYQTSFTLPDIKEGSIIEYTYKIVSPYRDNFADGWSFQNHLPKIKSTFFAKIPGFWEYHITGVGMKDPKFNQYKIINDCFVVHGAVAQCMFIEHTLQNIPSFIEEDFTTSKNNFLKRLKFELKTFTQVDGTVSQHTKSWYDINKQILKQYQIGKDYDKIKFISKYIPDDIKNEPNDLERAKKVFRFIQNHFTYNDETGSPYKFERKKAFENKTGNLFEINTNLINALNAANIGADFAFLSTRENGLPNKVHPSFADFNYMVAHCKIDGIDYFLDAVDKNLSFGMLPFYCLNEEVRIFNNEKGSFWHEFEPDEKNGTTVYAIANVTEDSNIELQARVVHEGFNAYNKREKIRGMSIDEYKEEIDEENEDLQIVSHKIENLLDMEKQLIEEFEFESETDFINDKSIYLNPFVIKDFKKNPFTLNKRNYQVNLGYKRKYQYNLTYNIPENYTVESVPKDRNIVLPRKSGHLSYLSSRTDNRINIKFTFSLNSVIYDPHEYYALKKMMAQLIIAQNEMIILTKK